MKPSPRSHLYRLLLVLAVAGAGFVGLRQLAIPDSWDEEHWYRGDALDELAAQPSRFGGNASCEGSSCHEPPANHKANYDALSQGLHAGVACESCHGPLARHAADGEKLDHARLNVANELCLGCHQELIARPQNFPQFSETLLYHELLNVRETSPCRACHNPHEPA
ncbi:MAG: cytochrome c3 family protein [Gammaproteobacteria bacterium]|jgi:hypothetical protein|nr:cytochrome c3 family protein [Gammaproteobacteria bacterium]